MENIILGLLILQSRTIYQLRKRIDEGLNLMYSCSTGSIQAAIKKLLKSGYIVVEEVLEGNKLKKLYTITPQGKEYFDLWISSPIQYDSVKNPELAKLYFMGLADKEKSIKVIEQYIADLEKVLRDLDVICLYGEVESKKSNDNNIMFYQLQTAIYGRDFMRFNIEWYKKFLQTVRSNQR